MQCQRSFPELCGRNPRHPDIDGHGLHVEALTGYTVSMSAQQLFAPGGAIAANNVNLKIGIPERGSQAVQKVEYAGSYSRTSPVRWSRR